MTMREATPCERCGLWCAWSEWRDVISRPLITWGGEERDPMIKRVRSYACRCDPERLVVEMRIVLAPPCEDISITTAFEAA